MSYTRNLIVSIDQLFNTICGGDPDNTLSARVGFFSRHEDQQLLPKKLRMFYKMIERPIDLAYEHADGKGHCRQAFEDDPDEEYTDNNWGIFLFLMSLIIYPLCVVVGGFIHMLRELGCKKFKKGARLPSVRRNFFEKWIRKVFWICIGILLIPLSIVVAVWLILMINAVILLIPIWLLVECFGQWLRKLGLLRSKGVNPSQSNNNITIKVKNRLIKGTRKFQKVLNKSRNHSITIIIVMDMLQELFGYYKYSGITLQNNSINNSLILIAKIDHKPEFPILVYPIGFDLNQVPPQQVSYYNSIPAVDIVILTNGIEWNMYSKNGGSVLKLSCEFDLLTLDPKQPPDIARLYNVCKESLV